MQHVVTLKAFLSGEENRPQRVERKLRFFLSSESNTVQIKRYIKILKQYNKTTREIHRITENTGTTKLENVF